MGFVGKGKDEISCVIFVQSAKDDVGERIAFGWDENLDRRGLIVYNLFRELQGNVVLYYLGRQRWHFKQ
jgi:hypothetical protein